MDGVIWRDRELLPGAAAFFAYLKSRNLPYVFATNNSTHTVEHYVELLNGFSIPVEPRQIVSSGSATAAYLAERYPPGTRVYVVGHIGLKKTLQAYGFILMDAPGITPEVVVSGIDRGFTYDKLKAATTHIRNGAVFIGTNGDHTFPVPGGLAPGAGSILAAIEAATDTRPVIIGKPEKPMFEISLQRLGTRPEETLMIGDRIETDIEGAQNASMKTALMLSGVAKQADIINMNPAPDYVFENLAALLHAFGK